MVQAADDSGMVETLRLELERPSSGLLPPPTPWPGVLTDEIHQS